MVYKSNDYHVTDILRHELGKLRKTVSIMYRRQLPKDSFLSTKFEVPINGIYVPLSNFTTTDYFC